MNQIVYYDEYSELCFRHAVLHAINGRRIVVKIINTVFYVRCADCEKNGEYATEEDGNDCDEHNQ